MERFCASLLVAFAACQVRVLPEDENAAGPDSGSPGKCTDEDEDGWCGGSDEDCDDRDAAIHPGAAEQGPWSAEIVDLVADDGEYLSLAIDAAGYSHLHYLYSDNSGDELVHEFHYATNRSGAWMVERLESAAGSHQPTDIAVDAAGTAHVAYLHWDYPKSGELTLRYANNATGAWDWEMLLWQAGWSDSVSIAVDESRHVHIAYPDNRGQLLHFTNTSGGWEVETAIESFAGGAAIALDAVGNPHISYLRPEAEGWEAGYSIRHLVRAGGEWTDEFIADGERGSDTFWNQICCTALAFDASGNAHLTFPGDKLGYATNASGSWVASLPIDPAGEDAFVTSLAVGPAGVIQASYLGVGTAGQYLATDVWHAANDGGDWSTELVDGFDRVDSFSSMALAPDGSPRIAYVDGSDRLALARRASDGVDQNCDGVD